MNVNSNMKLLNDCNDLFSLLALSPLVHTNLSHVQTLNDIVYCSAL